MARPKNVAPVEAEPELKQHRRSRIIKIKKSYVALSLLLILIGVGGLLGYKEYDKVKRENKQLQDPQQSARIESDRIKQEVSKLIDIPQNEEPTIATVVDVEKLKNQAFFAKAQNGDRVLMFPESKKAVLYRPSVKKIIEVAPINIGNNQQPQPAAQPSEQPNGLNQ